jgi:hypothetical protein
MLRNFACIATCFALVFAAGCSSKNSDTKSTTSANKPAAKKGSTASGASGSKSAGQKTGSSLTSNKGQATDKGTDLDGATCDDSLEGTAWCGDDTTAIFCSGGHWYALDCSSIGGAVCAETIDADTVECDSADDLS